MATNVDGATSRARDEPTRRAFLQCAPVLGAGMTTVLTAGCSSSADDSSITAPPEAAVSSPSSATAGAPGDPARTLLVYFSRPGENYFDGGRIDLEVGNTEVLATAIAALVPCDVVRLEAADAYPESYDETVRRNAQEQDSDARPAIVEPPASIDQYDTVLIGSPVWNVRPPMIMASFAEAHDFAGKRVLPFVTYAVSGLGRADRDYSSWCSGAEIGEGLAIRGEEVTEHADEVEAWLRRLGLTEG